MGVEVASEGADSVVAQSLLGVRRAGHAIDAMAFGK
jgi:hypothetical protein